MEATNSDGSPSIRQIPLPGTVLSSVLHVPGTRVISVDPETAIETPSIRVPRNLVTHVNAERAFVAPISLQLGKREPFGDELPSTWPKRDEFRSRRLC